MLYAVFPLASFAGFAAICASMLRHAPQVFGRDIRRSTALLLRIAATALLAIAWAACVGCWGAAMGTVAWVCILPLAAIAVVVCLTYSPRNLLLHGAFGAAALTAALAAIDLIG